MDSESQTSFAPFPYHRVRQHYKEMSSDLSGRGDDDDTLVDGTPDMRGSPSYTDMSSEASGHDDDDDDDDMLVDDIPDFARAWHPSVRRPSKLPDPLSYHEVIDPQAIFELDEDGSTEPILVVPSNCKYCKSVAQACSRSRPTCARCNKAGKDCQPSKQGYTKLPRPKVQKPPVAGTKNARNIAKASSEPQQAGSSRSRVALSSNVNGGREAGLSRTLKRPLSPQAVLAPQKKPQIKTAAPKGKAICKSNEPSKVADNEVIEHAVPESQPQPNPAVTVSNGERSGPKWKFIKGSSGRDENLTVTVQDGLTPAAQSSAPIPRAWTNSRAELSMVFPDLAKAPTGLSWSQSLTPILVLETNHPEDHWTCSTTLNINLLWDFSCSNFDLETRGIDIAPQSLGHSEYDSQQPEVRLEDCPSPSDTTANNVFPESQTMAIANSAPSPGPLISGKNLQDTENVESVSESATSSVSPFVPLQQESDTVMFSTPSASGELLANTVLVPTGSTISSSPPQVNLSQSIPLIKPPDIQTLLDSRAHLAPVLIWSSRDCKLMPCTLPQEYAYSCLGFFFISDLRHEVINNTTNFTTDAIEIKGRVCWHVTLEWAPGGETALFSVDADRVSSSEIVVDGLASPDSHEDLSHPWWLSGVEPEVSPQANTAAPYRPRDLRMHYFSYLPLDLLAEFHPSESFPRGWFCEKCRMINAQKFFRHQICQSSVCKSVPDERTLQGKIDPLWELRDPHHSHFLTYPTVNVPSFLQYNERSWDDGMQAWTYLVKNGVSLRHVFTGNQENLQIEATTLLERIQCDVLLKKEDPSSPYFMHTATLIPGSHDTRGTTVPAGTSAAIRSICHALTKLVEGYGELAKPRFCELLIRAWVTTGSKKGNVFHAKKSPVVILCLGAQVILKFIPKAGYGDSSQTTTTDKVTCGDDRLASPSMERRAESPLDMTVAQDSGFKVDQRPPSNSQSEKNVKGVAIVADHEHTGLDPDHSMIHSGSGLNVPSQPGLDDVVLEHKTATEPKERHTRQKTKAIKEKSKPIKEKKTPHPEICLTLVHGDGVILIGDDFECQIIRTGTTILVTGSCEGSASY
ncbi:hypothetical protein BDN67DRAFT_1070101 [Paxillus ammoniavirescens]|nr:hypothetical protein BDN67DRAFT_1070101 [Paxillus ammoniavirescens]